MGGAPTTPEQLNAWPANPRSVPRPVCALLESARAARPALHHARFICGKAETLQTPSCGDGLCRFGSATVWEVGPSAASVWHQSMSQHGDARQLPVPTQYWRRTPQLANSSTFVKFGSSLGLEARCLGAAVPRRGQSPCAQMRCPLCPPKRRHRCGRLAQWSKRTITEGKTRVRGPAREERPAGTLEGAGAGG